MTQNKKLSLAHFEDVLNKAYDQVAVGKGKQRHGITKQFSEQPWKLIADTVGPEFLIGQAVKKLMELKAHKINEDIANEELEIHEAYISSEKWMTDALGAIVYTVMAIMYKEHQLEHKHPNVNLAEQKQ
jgi:hypothetical protein